MTLRFIARSEGRDSKREWILVLHPWLAAERLFERGDFSDPKRLKLLNELLLLLGWETFPLDREPPAKATKGRPRKWTRPKILDGEAASEDKEEEAFL